MFHHDAYFLCVVDGDDDDGVAAVDGDDVVAVEVEAELTVDGLQLDDLAELDVLIEMNKSKKIISEFKEKRKIYDNQYRSEDEC